MVPSRRFLSFNHRTAPDIVPLARKKHFDVAVVFGQDQDLQEILQEVRDISQEENCWIKVVSAFPFGPSASSKRGIDKTQWVKIEREIYDKRMDEHDCRPEKFKTSN